MQTSMGNRKCRNRPYHNPNPKGAKMSRSYKAASKKLQEDPGKPFIRRQYDMILVNPKHSRFDEDHATLKAAQEDDANPTDDRVALRIQIIKDPTRAFGDARLLQFYAQDPNRDSLTRTQTNARTGIIVEVEGSKETPLVMLNSDEVWELAHGNGYNAPILTAAVPVAT